MKSFKKWWKLINHKLILSIFPKISWIIQKSLQFRGIKVTKFTLKQI